MGQYAKHREALRASRNAALHMGRSHDVMMLDSWPRDPTSSRSVERAVAPVPRVVGGLGAAEPLQFPHATPSPLAAAYAGYDATFSGPDGTRHDPRFVDARHRPSDAEVAYLRRELSDEQRRLLALEEQLGQHKAREGRIARTVDVSPAILRCLALALVLLTLGCMAQSALSGYSPPTPSTLGELAPTVGGGYELESIYSAMRAQQWEIEALAREYVQLLVSSMFLCGMMVLLTHALVGGTFRCRGLTHMRRMPQTQLVQMYPPMVGPALGSAGPSQTLVVSCSDFPLSHSGIHCTCAVCIRCQ